MKLRRGRGKDHPRYGRFVYALAKHYQPQTILEVGTFTGGTAIGWATALRENGSGQLICIDNDSYSKNTYPEITRRNLASTGLSDKRFELLNGDSQEILKGLEKRLRNQVDIYLVDGDHTYEGALADIEYGLPLVRPGGLILVHDVDPARAMGEATAQHPYPVLEAFNNVARKHGLQTCVLKFIRKHLGVIRQK